MMKKLTLSSIAAILVLSACGKKEEKPVATTPPAKPPIVTPPAKPEETKKPVEEAAAKERAKEAASIGIELVTLALGGTTSIEISPAWGNEIAKLAKDKSYTEKKQVSASKLITDLNKKSGEQTILSQLSDEGRRHLKASLQNAKNSVKPKQQKKDF